MSEVPVQDEGVVGLDGDPAAVKEIVAGLAGDEVARCLELGVLAAGMGVPAALVAGMWKVRGGLGPAAARRLLARLSELSVSVDAVAPAVVVKRGVVTVSGDAREYFRGALGPDDLVGAGEALVDAAALDLLGDEPGAADGVVPWWTLDRRLGYLWDHLVWHLVEAGRGESAEALVGDLRWVVARVGGSGLGGLAADLRWIGKDRLPVLRAAMEAAGSVAGDETSGDLAVDELLGALSAEESMRARVREIQESLPRPVLIESWPSASRDDDRRAGANLRVADPDGEWFATTTPGEPPVLRIWDTATGACRRFTANGDAKGILAVAPDASWVATRGTDGAVGIWDTATGECRSTLTGHGDGWVTAVVAPDGSWMVTGGEASGPRVWDTGTGQCVRELPVPGRAGERLLALRMADNGSFVFVAGGKTTNVFDTRDWTRVHEVDNGGGWGSAVVVPSADGSRVACRLAWSKKIGVWSTSSGECLRSVSCGNRHYDQLCFSPDGDVLVIVFSDHHIRLFDPSGSGRPRVLKGHTSYVLVAEVSADGRWLATASDDRTLRVWDMGTGDCVSTARTAVPVSSCAWLPGNRLAVGGKRGPGLYELRLP